MKSKISEIKENKNNVLFDGYRKYLDSGIICLIILITLLNFFITDNSLINNKIDSNFNNFSTEINNMLNEHNEELDILKSEVKKSNNGLNDLNGKISNIDSNLIYLENLKELDNLNILSNISNSIYDLNGSYNEINFILNNLSNEVKELDSNILYYYNLTDNKIDDFNISFNNTDNFNYSKLIILENKLNNLSIQINNLNDKFIKINETLIILQ